MARTRVLLVALAAGLLPLVTACGGDGPAGATSTATVTATVTASPTGDGSLSLRRVCDDFQWFPNPPSSDALRPWSGIYDDLSVVVLYADPAARAALRPVRAAANRASNRQVAPDDEQAYQEYQAAYDGLVTQCRAAGSTALS